MDKRTVYILKGCLEGNRTAQAELYGRYAGALYSSCLRITGNPQEAEEAMQDAFLKVFSKMERYDTAQSFDVWIRRIAVNTAIDYIRRRIPSMEDIPANHAAEPESADDKDIEYSVEQVKDAVKKLPDKYRAVLSLYVFEGYDMEEIASILSIQPSTVRTQYMRAKRKLMEIITAN